MMVDVAPKLKSIVRELSAMAGTEELVRVHRCLRLLEINPDASWDEKPTKWPLSEIRRVEVGSRYAEALHAIGGDASE